MSTQKSVYACVLSMCYVCIGWVYTKCVHITYIGVCSCIIQYKMGVYKIGVCSCIEECKIIMMSVYVLVSCQ